MRFRTLLTYLALLPLSACTKSCNDYDNNEEFARARLPAYTETGANTLGCVLGPQTWTVLGAHLKSTHYRDVWEANQLYVSSGYPGPPQVQVRGQMTGVRNSKTFYDYEIQTVFTLSDTLGGLRLLGSDTVRVPRQGEYLAAYSFFSGRFFASAARRPVRLFIRRLDRQQRTVSGTFAGTLYQTDGPDSLIVTDGRFDVRY